VDEKMYKFGDGALNC